MSSIKESQKLLGEATKILSKENNITLKDYKKFVKIGKKIHAEHAMKYAWLSEGMILRSPEVALATGNYNFMNDDL